MKISEKIAQDLLRIGAVKLQPEDPFTWASGLKSPIYTDNRTSLAYPEVRSLIANSLADLAKAYKPDAIVGVATAGIPHAALIADLLNCPMAYVRSKAKGHGRQNKIEGQLKAGQKVVVIEDLISTGGSSIEAVYALRDAGIEVLSTLAIFTYGFDKAVKNFENAKCEFQTLTDYNTLISVAQEGGALTAAQIEHLLEWKESTSKSFS